MLRTWMWFVSLTAAAAWAQQPVVCPATASLRETASAAGWQSAGGMRTAPLERISIFDGPPAEMADLAPSGSQTSGSQTKGPRVTQTWDLAGYTARPLYLVCRYQGTEATLTRVLPRTVRRCTLAFTLTAGKITGTTTMSCQ